MQYNWIIWYMFYVIGAVCKGIQADQQNSTQASTRSRSDDYDSNYPDYIDRDYLNFDYYDNREGKSLNDEENNTPHGDNYNRHKQDEEFMMKQLQSTIPGTPGVDYALYQSVPDTSFQCGDQRNPGFYGDVEAQCQVFHICQEDDRHDSFLCPVGTVFNQISFICDWWFNFNCEDTPMYYHLNDKFDASSGSTSMKDTMERMKNFQDKKRMGMITGLAKVHKKLHNIQNMMKDDARQHSKTPKLKNLFMLGMRRNTLERIRSQLTSKRSTDDNTTPNTLPTPLPLRAASSTGYIDVALTEYTTVTNTSYDDLNTEKLLSVSESATEVTEPFNATEFLPYTTSFNGPFTSVLNTSSIEMIINGSITTTVKLDHVEDAYIESTTVTEYVSTEAYNMNKTEETIILMEDEKKSEENEKPVENSTASVLQKENFSDIETDVFVENKTFSIPTESNASSPIALVSPVQEPTNRPLSKPFSHENNFIIGNDTHISVSVTIHSKSGRSKLQWKRLPGIKRIRKIRFKNTEENTTTQNSNSDTTYKRRNNDEKPRSRIMWIPAKKDVLERKMDWKSFLESRNYGTVSSAKMEPIKNQPLKTLEKAAFENGADLLINISDNMYYTSENSTTTIDNQESTTYAMTSEILPEDSTTIQTLEDKGMVFTLLETITKSSESNSKVENTSNLELESFKDLEEKANLSKNYSEVSTDNCKTICIKLLRSLHKNPSRDYPNSTNFENAPSALTLFNYDSSDSHVDPKYGRKGVLGVSPSEQWTVKYDPGPNCNENTEDDKVLVKGWSVIIDTGSVTKEKTVKKRVCADNLDNSKVVVMRNSYDNSRNKGITFGSETSHNPLNSQSHLGSTDQRYWLNLVRNWLEQSPNINEELTKQSRNTSPYHQWQDVKLPNSQNKRNQDSLQQRHNPKRQNSYNSESDNSRRIHFSQDQTNFGHRNQKFDAKNLARNFKDTELFPRNNEKPRKFNIRNTKPDWHSDLQTERSDWFQATQKTNDWNNKGINSKGSSRDNMRDWVPEQRNTRTNPMINLNKGTRDSRAKTRQDTYSPGSQDYDDWSSKKPRGESWDDSGRNNDWQTGSDKSDWSEETRQDDDSWDSRPSLGRSDWDSRSDDWSSKDNKRMITPDKSSWPKSNRSPTDWSDESRKGTGKNEDTMSWKRGTTLNRRMKNKGFQDEFMSTGNNDERIWSAMKGTKGRSVSDEWNWAPEKGYDINIGSMNDDRRNDWSSMNSRDTDKKLPRRDSWGSRMPGVSSRKSPEDNRRDWSSNDRNSGGRNSDSQWGMDGERKDKSRRNLAGGSKGNVPKTDWNLDENRWKDEEQRNFKSDDWNQGNSRDMIGSSKGSKRDWNSQTDNKQDWSSGSRGGRNKGFAVHSKESSDWSSENNPEKRKDDMSNRDWSSKASSGDNSRFPSRSLRSNAKGDPNLGSKRPPSSHTSWSSNNGNDWDKQMWMNGNSRRNSQKGDPNPQKPANNPKWKSDFPDSQEWFSGEDTDEDDFQDKSWNLPKGIADSHQSRPKNDNEWATRKKMEADSRSNRTPLSKGTRGDDRSVSGSGSWNTDDSFSKGTDKPPQNSKPKGFKGNKPESNKGRDSWGSTKGNNKGSMRPPQTSSSKGSARSKPTMPWNTDEKSPKNVNNNKGDAGMKKIVWSVQISSDGKTGNGWVPITLRPDLRTRRNGTQSDWNNKGNPPEEDWPIEDTKKGDWNNKENPPEEDWPIEDMKKADWNNKENPPEEDWPIEDMKKADWKSEISQFRESTPAETNDDATETSPSTSQMTEASFSQLFYIPAFRNRYKREYTNDNGKNSQARNSTSKSYKIIKSGEVLNDVSRDNKFFLATANILVGDRQWENQHPGLKKVVGQNTLQISQNSKSPVTNDFKNFRSHPKDVKYWDTFPKESVISERWSSPFNPNNFSASGWIPVMTPKPSESGRNSTNLYSFIHRRNDEIMRVNNSSNVTKEPDFRIPNTNLKQFTQKNTSQDFPSFSHSKTFDILSHNIETKNALNEAEERDTDSEIGTEMKVGNKTLRILSFSDVMKQLRDEDDQFQDSHNFDPHEMPWNLPIMTDPITYSLKLIDTSKETPQNISNSWIFASNGNSTKHAWILMGSYNTTKQSPSNKTSNIGDMNKNLHNETYNRPTSENTNKLFNSTLLPDKKEATSNNTFHFKSRNWNSDSDWRPVIRTIGRVVSHNRTLLLTKESNME